ncbi:MAG: cob(I)yrinic acid a,c-diamide adenosyltransferase [Planctomycetales bacterium]|nr:cob(I)yrinic acid a,c-diamide adenosyltransferase [Planctomycetales bacterium]
MKIYTKTGDEGQTGLFAGPRVDKDHPRIEAYGTVDELNAAIGLARSFQLPGHAEDVFAGIQHDLFALGAELATPDPQHQGTSLLTEARIKQLEQTIDTWEQSLPPLQQFILPAGASSVAAIHLARAICRRAERHVVTLMKSSEHAISQQVLAYLNRLGDLLFVASRWVNQELGGQDQPWKKPQANA